MKAIIAVTVLSAALFQSPVFAEAAVLSPAHANAICQAKVKEVVKVAGSPKGPLVISFQADSVAEISTRITYQFAASETADPRFTVVAYAYPDDHSCTIGSFQDNLAGND